MKPPTSAASTEPTPVAGWLLLPATVAVGLVAGVVAVVFRDLIGGFHNLLFLGRFSFYYDANLHTAASPWGAWIIAVPVLGAVGVAFLVKTLRARGQRLRRARSDGRHLLSRG